MQRPIVSGDANFSDHNFCFVTDAHFNGRMLGPKRLINVLIITSSLWFGMFKLNFARGGS